MHCWWEQEILQDQWIIYQLYLLLLGEYPVCFHDVIYHICVCEDGSCDLTGGYTTSPMLHAQINSLERQKVFPQHCLPQCLCVVCSVSTTSIILLLIQQCFLFFESENVTSYLLLCLYWVMVGVALIACSMIHGECLMMHLMAVALLY